MMKLTRRAALAGATLAAAAPSGKLRAAPPDAAADLRLVEPPVPAPKITFLDADGSPHELKEYHGTGVVLNLWATWCAPCVAELPSLDRLAGKLNPRRIKVLALSSDRGGATAVRAFYQQHGITSLPILLDPQGAAMRAFKVRGIPTTFIIDGNGMERAYAEGSEDWDGAETVERIVTLVGV